MDAIGTSGHRHQVDVTSLLSCASKFLSRRDRGIFSYIFMLYG